MRHLFSSSPSFSDDDEYYYYARAVRYIFIEIVYYRGKTERESPLLHREMIRHVIEAALLWPIVVKNPRSKIISNARRWVSLA